MGALAEARSGRLAGGLLVGCFIATVAIAAFLFSGFVSWSTSGAPADAAVSVCETSWPCLSFGVGGPSPWGLTFPWDETGAVRIEVRRGSSSPACWEVESYVVRWDHLTIRFSEDGMPTALCVAGDCNGHVARRSCEE